MLPAASIIIPTLNEEGYLPRLLDSLSKISSPLDIIVVDGASEDGTVRVVEKYQSAFTMPSSLTLLRSEVRGISLQRNLGAARARHDIMIFCDADVIFPPGTYEKILTEFSSREYTLASPLLIPLEQGIHRTVIYLLQRSVQKALMVFGRPYFPGACLITTKKVFTEADGFDVNVVLGEDVDYSMRASKFGTFGLLNVKIAVSDRRAIKYGYSWVVSEIPNILSFLFTGHLKSETFYYPFGEYGGQEAHHVTKNTRR